MKCIEIADAATIQQICRAQNWRADASESVWFQRELETIDPRAYEFKFPTLKSTQIIPLQPNVPEWALVYSWRMFEGVGQAEFISNMADDLPMADAKGTESSKVIKPIGKAYGWNWFELNAAAATGRPLDQLRIKAARKGVEQKIDTVMATGDSAHNLDGLLNLTGIPTFTLLNKAAGGTRWIKADGSPNATAKEVAADLKRMAGARVAATDEMFSEFTIVLPIDEYEYATEQTVGETSMTALQLALQSPHINRIVPWAKCTGAGSGVADRICLFPEDPEVVAGILPMPFRQLPGQWKNLKFTVPCVATVGGVVVRYTIAMAYADING